MAPSPYFCANGVSGGAKRLSTLREREGHADSITSLSC